MKLSLVVLAALVTATTAYVSGSSSRISDKEELTRDLEDFINALPEEEILNILVKYASQDTEFVDCLVYLQSKEFKEVLVPFFHSINFRAVLDYLEESNFDAYGFVNMLNALLGLDELEPNLRRDNDPSHETYGFKGLAADLKAVIPYDDIKIMFLKKLVESRVFTRFVMRVVNKEFREIVDVAVSSQEFLDIVEHAKANDIDVEGLQNLILSLIDIKNFRSETSSLREYLKLFESNFGNLL